MSHEVSILVVVAAPDTRGSSHALQQWVARLARRPGVRCEVWFLRDFHGWAWPGSRTVDRLRTWPVARALDGVGLSSVANRLRGLRLRRWARALSPDVVIFNDGLGERVLDGYAGAIVSVCRENFETAVDAELEAPGSGRFDVMLGSTATAATTGTAATPDTAATTGTARTGTARTGTARMVERTYDSTAARHRAAPRQSARAALGIPVDQPLIVGWGDDSWVDGPDVFIRALWALEARHGVIAHGVWLCSPELDHEEARLIAEARRCGVGDRYHRSDDVSFTNKVCGDAVLLPYRAATDPIDVLDVIATGLCVVTFGNGIVDDPLIVSVPYLDVDAAASALNEAIAGDRAVRTDEVNRRIGVDSMLDELVALARPTSVGAAGTGLANSTGPANGTGPANSTGPANGTGL